MSIQILTNKKQYREELTGIFGKIGIKFKLPKTFEETFQNSFDSPSKVYLLQTDFDANLRMLDFIRDLRTMFGAAPTIIMIGEKETGDGVANFMGIGADNIFSAPFDKDIVAHEVSKYLTKDLTYIFKYRSVPSGGSPIRISSEVYVVEINANGVHFESESFFTKDFVLEVDLGPLVNMGQCKINLKVLQNYRAEQSYEYFAEFYEVSDDDRKKIIYQLKTN